MQSDKVMIVPICERRQFTYSGTPAAIQLGPALRDIGPYIEDIVVHALVEDVGGTWNYTLTAEYSYDGEVWTAFASPLISGSTAGNDVGTPYTTRTDFGMWIRFKVGIPGLTVGDVGTLSLKAAIKFWS